MLGLSRTCPIWQAFICALELCLARVSDNLSDGLVKEPISLQASGPFNLPACYANTVHCGDFTTCHTVTSVYLLLSIAKTYRSDPVHFAEAQGISEYSLARAEEQEEILFKSFFSVLADFAHTDKMGLLELISSCQE